MVSQRLGGDVFWLGDLLERCVECLAVSIGCLEVERGRGDFGPFGIGKRKEGSEPIGRCLLGYTEFVVGPILVEFGLTKLERSGLQVFAIFCPPDDVAEPLQEIAADDQPLAWIGLCLQLIDVELRAVSGFCISRHSANLRHEGFGQAWIKVCPPNFCKSSIELFRLLLKGS